jgi:hypothetical protein
MIPLVGWAVTGYDSYRPPCVKLVSRKVRFTIGQFLGIANLQNNIGKVTLRFSLKLALQ